MGTTAECRGMTLAVANVARGSVLRRLWPFLSSLRVTVPLVSSLDPKREGGRFPLPITPRVTAGPLRVRVYCCTYGP